MWTVKRDDLNEVLEVLAMVPEKLGLPSSEYIWVRGKGSKIKMSVASYTSGEVELEGEGEWPLDDHFFLDRRTFIPWVNAANESRDKHRFEFHKKHDQLLLKHGSRNVMFSNQKKIHGYGNLASIKKKAKHSMPVSKSLREMLSCGNNCAVSDTIQPHLNCVYTMGKGTNVVSYAASDYIFYIGEGDVGEKVKDKIPFPLFLIDLLAVESLKKITYAEKYILLHFKHGMIWQPVSEEAIDKFPLRRIRRYAKLSYSLPLAFTSSSRRFSRIIIRMGYYNQSVKKRDWIVYVRGKHGEKSIQIKSEVPGVYFDEKLPISSRVKNDFKVEWPLGALIKVFDFLSKNTKKKPLTLRVDKKHAHSYIRVGNYWLSIPSKQR